ncbi:MAG TPA: SUMF1/EgtB/PvdO family nonheme iron enzyme [Bacteroidales bacterium]|nr:SUMF1/EgtB/PvdO family nonheme iron enzyme [Bacteroidales bacterium]
MKKCITFLLLFAGLGLGANNLQIKNVALTGNDPIAKTVMIRFDISWDHSWRDAINWDAAWVFAKYYDGTKPYRHCKLSLGGETPGTGTAHALIVPNDSLELDGTYYGVGAFIYRSELSDGTFAADSVMLQWNYGLNGFDALPEDIELHVYGTEMVYIPEGPFAFGDGNGESMNSQSWHLKGSPDNVYIDDYLSPLMVAGSYYADEQARLIGLRVHGREGLDWDGDGIIDNPNFPTGYRAFYMMKYETTQGQYTDFLNSLTENQISSSFLFPTDPNAKYYRFTITYEDGKYACARPDRACNYLVGYGPVSLADWMGLRPMTELEYEKAARGPLNPVVNEYAWGNTSETGQQLLAIAGSENGTEMPQPENANWRYLENHINGGDGGNGPVRAGIFANETSSRLSAGAGYYGVMELSGNLAEIAIELTNFDDYYLGGFRSYIDAHGDGELNSNGRANSILRLNPDGTKFMIDNIDFSSRGYNVSYSRFEYGAWVGARYVRNTPVLP